MWQFNNIFEMKIYIPRNYILFEIKIRQSRPFYGKY